MEKFEISNKASGVVLGVYEANSKADALDAMARDAGYSDYADAQDQAPAEEGEIIVILLAA